MKSIYLLLTDGCNLGCSFCYKKHVVDEGRKGEMSVVTGVQAVQWAIGEKVIDTESKDTVIYLWGGEPLSVMDTVKGMLANYPSIMFATNTNGLAVESRDVDYFRHHLYHFKMTLSLGAANDKFKGVKHMLECVAPLAGLIKEAGGMWGVNFTITKPETMFADFKSIWESGIHNIMIDMPTHMEITPEYKRLFIKGHLDILKEFHAVKSTGFRPYESHLTPDLVTDIDRMRYCGSGVDRLLIDFEGDVYPCDGFYIVKQERLGNIHTGVELSKLEKYQALAKDPSPFYTHCKGCEIEHSCPRAKCMGLNIQLTGDKYKPDRNFCEICKTFAEIRRIQKERHNEQVTN